MRTSLCTAAHRRAATAVELFEVVRTGVEADARSTIIFVRGPESTWNTASDEAC